MPSLPSRFAEVILIFAPLFLQQRTWDHAGMLLIGAILAPGQRTVTSLLRIMGLSGERRFVNYHRVLNRAVWSSRAASRLLLGLLITTLMPAGPVVLGLDDTIERRRGKRISARGIYRDPVRSSKAFFVKSSGLRWVSMMLLTPIPWALRVWALPFLTVLAPSEHYHQERDMAHKTLADWARQMIAQVRRWLPERAIVVVADSSYAVLKLLAASAQLPVPVTMITRLRLDAALYDPAPPREKGTRGAPRKKGKRQPSLSQRLLDLTTEWTRLTLAWYGRSTRTVELASGKAVWYHGGEPVVPLRWVLIRDPQGQFEPQALLSTDQELLAKQIVEWFVQRWQLEVT